MSVIPGCGAVWDGRGCWLVADAGWTVVCFCCWWIRRNSSRWSGGSWVKSTPATTDGCGGCCHAVDSSDVVTTGKDGNATDDTFVGGTTTDVGIGSGPATPTWELMPATAGLSVVTPADTLPPGTADVTGSPPAINRQHPMTHCNPLHHCNHSTLDWTMKRTSENKFSSISIGRMSLPSPCCEMFNVNSGKTQDGQTDWQINDSISASY